MEKFQERNGNIACLEGVVIGDRFLRPAGGWGDELEAIVCTKVTAKQCEIGEVRYWLKNASEVGRNSWSRRGALRNYDPAADEESKHIVRLRNLRYKLGEVKWKAIDDKLVEQVWGLLAGKQDGGDEA